jgi:CBS domain-containing protein
MKVRDILAHKGTAVITIGQEASLHDAVSLLNEHRIGVVLVTDAAGDPVGILSERDLVQIMATEGCKLDDKLVSDAMTADLIVGVPDDDLEYVMSVMIQRRIRHLPILDGDHLAGLVSIGDVVKSQIDDAVTEIRFLRSYIGGTRT